MKDAYKTSMKKTYGNGFDNLGLAEDTQAFLAWWNGQGHFPVDGAERHEAEAHDYPMAA